MLKIKRLVYGFLDGKLSEIDILETFLPIEGTDHDDFPGVYIILSKDKSLGYVGKSSRTMGDRIWTNAINAYSPGMEVLWKSDDNRKPYPYSVITIPFNEEENFLIPALESYLIEELPKIGIELLNKLP